MNSFDQLAYSLAHLLCEDFADMKNVTREMRNGKNIWDKMTLSSPGSDNFSNYKGVFSATGSSREWLPSPPPSPLRCSTTAITHSPSSRWIKDPERYKTVMCATWGGTGRCVYGRKCQFAHGKHELRLRRVPYEY